MQRFAATLRMRMQLASMHLSRTLACRRDLGPDVERCNAKEDEVARKKNISNIPQFDRREISERMQG